VSTGGSYLSVKCPEGEADHKPPFTLRIHGVLYLHPHCVFIEWCLIRHREMQTVSISNATLTTTVLEALVASP
jgi:hypothetical protein